MSIQKIEILNKEYMQLTFKVRILFNFVCFVFTSVAAESVTMVPAGESLRSASFRFKLFVILTEVFQSESFADLQSKLL